MGSLSTYLYVDKFLFKGKLAQLFFDGWRSLLREWFGPILRFSCRSSPEQPLASPEQEVISTLTDDNLVEKKRYVSRQKEPTGDIGPKREPKTSIYLNVLNKTTKGLYANTGPLLYNINNDIS